MVTLYLAAAVFIALVLSFREVTRLRERVQLLRSIGQLRQQQAQARSDLQHLAEELYLLRALLFERNVLNEREVGSARVRLIERPRRQAEERRVLKQHGTHTSTQVVSDDESNVH